MKFYIFDVLIIKGRVLETVNRDVTAHFKIERYGHQNSAVFFQLKTPGKGPCETLLA